MYIVQNFRTKNDTNGNPRRVFVVHTIRDGEVILFGVYDEGYKGYYAVPEHVRAYATQLFDVEITPREYKRIVREGIMLK